MQAYQIPGDIRNSTQPYQVLVHALATQAQRDDHCRLPLAGTTRLTRYYRATWDGETGMASHTPGQAWWFTNDRGQRTLLAPIDWPHLVLHTPISL